MIVATLNGPWKLKQQGAALALKATVPGDVYDALLTARKIPDPYYRDNELKTQWVGESGWTYSRTFDLPKALLAQERILLRCEGLDTLATVVLNHKTLGRTDNMFRTWEFDVQTLLKAKGNHITVAFASAADFAGKHAQGHEWTHGRNWVRKEQCNFGWDWGPTLVTCGIWRDIKLVGFSRARLGHVQIIQRHETGMATLGITAAVEHASAGPLFVRATVTYLGAVVAAQTVAVAGAAGRINVPIARPALWWPSGMGTQPLYTVTVELLDENRRELDRQVKRLGLRTLRLDRHEDRWGQSFQFVVNGVPFFAKGANWIPCEAVVARMTPQRYAGLIDSAVQANMNMLRLWGGGIYENDIFYDLCDERGICVWHDFMFACATYPTTDDAFMANVRREAEENVRRVHHHACIALWCGNNELEQGCVVDVPDREHMSWKDYGKLFDKMLPEIVHRLAPDTDYWPCSPHTPIGDRKNFNDPTCGDAHLWDVWHGRKPFEWYRTCTHRFNSEFGFQSFPEPATVRTITEPRDRNVTTYIMEHHQRSGIGNATIMAYMLDWFRLPTSFENTLWLSQVQQGMAIKYACEHWRRNMPRGMGTLYWQINDCWPVASWSSIDSLGRWKALHYMARKFFAPLLISGLEDAAKGAVAVHVTSDCLKPTQCRASWVLTDVRGKRLAGGTKQVTAAARADTPVETLRLERFIKKHDIKNLILWLDLQAAGKTVSQNMVTFARPKHLELENPGLSLKVRKTRDAAFTVTVEAKHPALWAWLTVAGVGAKTSDNFFHVRPGQPVTVTVSTQKKYTLPALKKALAIHSLFDTYQERA